eukprot:TRINITY_DN3078_c0_g1_i1.p1 TRINITY_DN3078_c0_g1~~TRINITY_DN3078_c0_g1_i1.p1  ORF type:complete len:139 (+),score=24.67 TRINITY_DN3078_c0_g1_i1:268-684(+)
MATLKHTVEGLSAQQLSELIKLSPKILDYKMVALGLSEKQKVAVRRTRRLEKARLYEKKKRTDLDFKINMLEAERNALLAVLDDLHEDVAQLRKRRREIKDSNPNQQNDLGYSYQGVSSTCQDNALLESQQVCYYPNN